MLIFLIILIMDSMKKRGKLIVKSSGGFSWGWILLLLSALRTRSRFSREEQEMLKKKWKATSSKQSSKQTSWLWWEDE